MECSSALRTSLVARPRLLNIRDAGAQLHRARRLLLVHAKANTQLRALATSRAFIPRAMQRCNTPAPSEARAPAPAGCEVGSGAFGSPCLAIPRSPRHRRCGAVAKSALLTQRALLVGVSRRWFGQMAERHCCSFIRMGHAWMRMVQCSYDMRSMALFLASGIALTNRKWYAHLIADLSARVRPPT